MSNGKSPFEGQILEPLDNGFSYLVPPLYVQGFFLNHFLKARRICIILGKLDLATTISLASQTFFSHLIFLKPGDILHLIYIF